MDFFKGIGDFFGGLFGKKKKQEEFKPVQETSSVSWQPPKQSNGLSFQADLGSTQFKPEKLNSNVDYSRNSLNPIPSPKKTDSTDFSKDDASGLNLDFSGKNKTTGNRFTMGNGSSLGNIAVHEDDINNTIKQLNNRYHNERDSLGRFWGSFIGDTDRRDRELRHKIIQNEMKKITDGIGYNQDGTYKRDYTDDEAYKMAALQLAERHGIDGAPLKSFMPSISVDKKPVNAKTFGENTLATANTIKNMTDREDGLGGIIGNILFGKKKQDEGFNLGRFLVDLPAGMVSGVAGIGSGVVDALSGKRMQNDGTVKDLSGLQRLGAGADAAIGAFGLPAGASGALVKSVFKNGAKQMAKEAGKAGVKTIAKNLAKGALSEGVEEGVQQIAQNLSSQDNYDGNGNLKIGKLVDGVIEATALGTLGGGIMGGASLGINTGKVKLGEIHQKVRSKIDENINPVDSPVQNAVLKVEANKNIAERFKNAYVDGRLPIPQTTITPNAGIKNRIETSFENGLTGDFGNGRDWIGRLKQNDIAMANDIQTATNRKLLNQNGDIYLDNYNAAEHAQKRFSENPELNTPKHLTDTAYNALFGDGRQILPNNPSNPNSVAFINKNDPTGFVSVGEGRSGNNELFTVVPSRRRELDSFESKNSLNKQGTPTEIGAIDTISQNSDDFNHNGGEVKYKLTPEQEEFFRNSKIRDENGNLKKMYHGSPTSLITEFRPRSYFTDNKNYAERYKSASASSLTPSIHKMVDDPKIYEVYIDAKNPFTLADETAKKIYMDEYVKGGNSAYLDPYADHTEEINSMREIDWTEGDEFWEWLRENHPEYDAIYFDEGGDGGYGEDYADRGISVVPLKKGQIKYVNNLNPTSNPDIRYKNGTTQDIQSFSEQNLRKIIGNEYDIISKSSDNTPRTAQGYVDLKNGIVAILDGKMSTANHEATHIAVNALNTVNPKLANSAIDGIVKQYGADILVDEANKAGYNQILGHKLDMNNVDDVRYAAEERLANDFAKYAEAKVKGRENYYVKKNSIPAQIKAWFDTVIDHLKDMVGRLDSAHDFMYRLERGDFADLIDQQMRVSYGQDNNVLNTRPQMAYRIDPETNIVHIENDILHGVSPKNRAKVIGQYFKDNYQGNNYELNFGKDGAARISAKSRNKYLDPNQSVSELILKGKMTGELPDILKVSQKIGEAPDTKNHSFARDGFEYRQSFVQIGDDLYSVKLNVGINNNGKLFYTINGIKKAPESHYRDLSGGDTYNISQDIDNVKMKLKDIEDLENLPKDASRKNTNSTETAQEEMGGQIQPENKAKNDGNHTRKFIETVLENAPPKDFRQAVEESNGKGKYNVRNTESLWKQAVEEVAKNPLGAFKDIEDARSDKAIAKGIALAEYFKAQGDNASSSAVYIKLAERATEAGRKVQALSLIKKSTPEGMLMSISRQIDAYNNLQDKRGRFAKDKIILDDQTRAYWYQRLQEIYEMPTKTKEQERTKKIAMGQFNKEVSKIFPSKKWDKTMAIWKAGLLSAPATHIRNIVGNTANLIGETVSNIVSVPADFVASKFTGIRSATLKGTKGYGRGLAEGWKTAGDIMRTGVDTSGDVIAKYDSKDVHFDSKLGKGIQAYTDTIFKALNAADKPFKQGMFESSIDSQAYAMAKNKGLKGKEAKAYAEELIKNPTVEMQEAATIDAEMATFQQPTALGNAIRGAKNKGGNVGKALDVLTPFTQVPSAVADQAVNYSPLGLVKAVKQFGDVKKAINAGLSEAQIMQLQRKAVKQTGRFLTGATLIGAGVILAKNGMLSGAAKDDKERRQWQAEGKMENAVKVGNDWFSLDSIAPELLILNAGGQLYKDLRNSNDIGATLAKSGLNVAKQFTEQSYMTGLKSGLDAVTDPEQSVGKLFGSLATSAIPNVVKKGAQSLDDKQRQVNSLEDSLKASIPGLRNTLPQKYDVYGRPMQSDMDFLETLFSPVRRTSIKENNLTNSVDVLREKDSDYDKIIPNRPPKTVKIGNENHTLTAEESSEYQRLMGELTSKYMQGQGFNDESFKKLSDDDKVKILTNIKTDVKSAVENHLFNNKNPKKMGDNKKIISRSLSGGQTADPVWQTKEEKKEDLYTRKEAEYEKFKREYDEKLAKGEYSRRGKIEAEGRLKKLEVGKNFMKETRDLYELGKRDFKKLIETAEDGEKVLKEVLAYGDALAKAGIEKNKFRDKYGNVKLDSERGGSRERSSGGGTPSYKMDTMALIRGALDYSKSGGVATKSYGRKSAARANTREVKRLSGKVNFSRK
nr:MAG TPA: PolyVal ADP-Ribosyltransferase [Caudoviricetes sp.]